MISKINSNTEDSEIKRIIKAIIIGLTLLDIFLLTVNLIKPFDPLIYEYVTYFDLFVVLILIIQFVYEFNKEEDKIRFIKHNWYDVIGMVPEIAVGGSASIFRYFRLIRILSLSRNSLKQFFNFIQKTHLELGIITIVFILISSAAIFYYFEFGVNSNVNSIDDALWYVLITITTVGFGDISPVTEGGRVATVIIIISGIGFISYLAAKITGWFLESSEKEEKNIEETLKTIERNLDERLDDIQSEINELKELIGKR